MNINTPEQEMLMQNSIGSVTRGMVRDRAFELAINDGRSLQETSKDDWENAKLELALES